MATKKLTKKQLKELARQIEELKDKYLKRHNVLRHHLAREYVRTQNLYEQPLSVVESTIRAVVNRLSMGYQMPHTQIGLLGQLSKLTAGSVKDVIKSVNEDAKKELIKYIVRAKLGDTSDLVKEIDKVGWDKFLQSKYYLPVNEIDSPRLRAYYQQFGETLTETRMRAFLNENRIQELFGDVPIRTIQIRKKK
jgi:hypothetical protein